MHTVRLSTSWVLFSITVFYQHLLALANDDNFVRATYLDQQGEHRYIVYVPPTQSKEKLPVILFLHSASERGDDGEKPIQVGLGPAIRARSGQFPFLAVFPQCNDMVNSVREAWGPSTSTGQRALAILDKVVAEYQGDPDRVYLIGCSMGGYGAWAHAAANPDRWAAVVPICGGGKTEWAKELKELPIWCFHGSDDRAVPVEESRMMIEAMRAAGKQPRYSELPGVRHAAWDIALHVDELYRWLLQQQRGVPLELTTMELSIPVSPSTTASVPFVSALDIPNAASVRLGNNMLHNIGHALPRMVNTEQISGKLPDNKINTSTPLGPMSVRFVDLSYTGNLSRTKIKTRQDGKITIRLRARNVKFTINRTYVTGSRNSATCGPIRIQMGHRYNLAINCVVRPVVQNKQLKLELEEIDFHIPSDNWHVSSPAWIQTRGPLLTRERVSSSLRRGFYRDRSRIESQVKKALPEILDRLTNTLPLERAEEVLGHLWPMPVYAPRVKAWPSSVAVDEHGVTLNLGLSVASLNAQQEKAGPQILRLPEDIPFQQTSPDFQLSFAPSLLEPLSRQVVDAGVARILVVDSPLKSLLPLADATALSMIVPDLNSRPDVTVRSEIIMNKPCRLHSDEKTPHGIELELPNITCQVSIPSESTDTQWTDYLSVQFSIRQKAQVRLDHSTPSTRAISLNWTENANISVSADFAPGYPTTVSQIDTEALKNIVAEAWNEWITDGPLAKASIEDFRLGPDRLRAENAIWRGHRITVTFVPATTEIRNSTGTDIAYHTKGPYSNWSSSTDLAVDKTHRFKVPYNFRCRFKNDKKTKTYTLETGRRYEFRPYKDGLLELFTLPDKFPEPTAPSVEKDHEVEITTQ